MKISIIVASMNRPQMLEECLRSIRETTIRFDIEVICVIDEDQQSWEVAYNFINSGIFNKERVGTIAAFNQGLQKSRGDIIFPMGDDGLCHPGWLDVALECHQNKLGGYGMLALNDLMLNGDTQLGTTLLYDRKFCKDILGGVAAYPVYNYYYIDNELNERAKRVGKYYWCQESVVEHRHSSNKKRPYDENDKSRDGFMEKDRLIFEDRKARGFPNDFESWI